MQLFANASPVSSAVRNVLLFAVTSLALLAVPSPADADTARPSFFNSREIRSADISRFKKWNGALKRHSSQTRQMETSGLKQWRTFLDSVRGASKWQQLSAVNDYMNTRRYVTDDRNWGTTDYWAAPAEFLDRSAGDCEDYAIAKYLSLQLLGWTDDEMRIVAVKDLQKGIGHAVLVAFHDSRTLVLDNQTKHIMQAEEIRHYQPVYSINATSWWLHRKGPRI